MTMDAAGPTPDPSAVDRTVDEQAGGRPAKPLSRPQTLAAIRAGRVTLPQAVDADPELAALYFEEQFTPAELGRSAEDEADGQGADPGGDTVPTRHVTATLVLQVEATLATRDCTGRDRGDLIQDLCAALEVGIAEDVPYSAASREPTDLIQDIQAQVRPLGRTGPGCLAPERIRAALDAGINLVRDGLALGERDDDLLDLAATASLALLREPSLTLDEVIRAAYDQTPAQVRQWWSGWA